MGVVGTAIIYVIIGIVIATAIAIAEKERNAVAFVRTAVFWPVFAPFVFAGRMSAPVVVDARIQSTEDRLVASLGKLEGIAEEILQPEIARIRGLANALKAMEKRVADMDALLATPEFSRERARAALTELEGRSTSEDPRRQSIESRLRNIDRLSAMRARTAESLERALLEMEEMSAQMMVLKFAGRPEAEVVSMIKDIAASIEAVTEGLLEAT